MKLHISWPNLHFVFICLYFCSCGELSTLLQTQKPSNKSNFDINSLSKLDSEFKNKINITVPENSTNWSYILDSSRKYILFGGADAQLFDLDTQTKSLTFRSTPDFEAPYDANTDNIYEIEILVIEDTKTKSILDMNVSITDIKTNFTSKHYDKSPTKNINDNYETDISMGHLNADDIIDTVQTRWYKENRQGLIVIYGANASEKNTYKHFLGDYLTTSPIIADFNGDELNDIFVFAYSGSQPDVAQTAILMGTKDNDFNSPIFAATQDAPSTPRTFTSADMNKDGWPDVIYLSKNSRSLVINFAQGDGSFEKPYYKQVKDDLSSLEVDDVNQDGNLDVVGAFQHTDAFVVMFGNGE